MNLEQVSEMANRVAAEHDALEDAKEEKGKAEDELLQLIVHTIKPALPAMASKVEGCAGPITRGVLIQRELRIYLGEHGDWFHIDRAQEDKPYVMNTSEVLNILDLGFIVAQLVQMLHQQIGSREKVTQQIRHETQKLIAISTLLAQPSLKR